MRLIGNLPSESDASRFSDFLLAAGMRNHIEAGNNGDWLVWIEHDDHIEQGQIQLRAYQANPNDPRYAEVEAVARRARKAEAQAAEKRRRNFTDVRTSWSGARVGATPVAIALTATCIIVALLTRLGMTEIPTATQEALVFQPISALFDPAAAAAGEEGLIVGKYIPQTMFSSIAQGQVWRLVTPMFLHFGVIHLIFNLSWLFTFGKMIESRKGSMFFLGLVVAAAVFSNCLEALWTVYGPFNRLGFATFGGFSGVNYALFGYAWLKGKYQPYEGIGVNQQTVGLMIGWLFLCMTGMIGPIANAAHVGGFLVGCLAGGWHTLSRRIKNR